MRTITFALCLLGMFAASASAVPIIIDDFTDGDTNILSANPGPETRNESGLSGVIGGHRRTVVERVSGTGTVISEVSATGDYVSLNSPSGGAGSFEFLYGLTVGGTGTPYDLSQGGSNAAIVIRFNTADYGSDVTVTLKDSDGDIGSFTLSPIGTVGTPQYLQFPFTAYSSATGGAGDGIQFDSITDISAKVVHTVNGTDCEINIISAEPLQVPDPATWCFFALLGSGLAVRHVRRKK